MERSIKALNLLTPGQEAEIRSLEAICNEHDKTQSALSLDTSLNFDREMNVFFLLYEGEDLVGVLTMFAPMRSEAEVSALIRPDCRRKGCFAILLRAASDEVKKFGVGDFLFVCDRDSDAGFETVSTLGATLDHTEYTLKFAAFERLPIGGLSRLTLKHCGEEDIAAVASLSAQTFHDDRPDDMAKKNILSDNREQYLALYEGTPVGIVATGREEEGICIYGLGIHPDYERRGFGREMLSLLLNLLNEQGQTEIRIEVDNTNAPAFHLYTTSGFEAERTTDYYRKKIN